MNENSDPATVVREAYRRFRDADVAMHVRIRTATGMTDNELRIVRFLLSERGVGHEVKPSEISRHLEITSASTTALLDRLERAGMVERVSHPTDRRSILIAATPRAEQALAETIEEFDRRLAELASGLDEAERRNVAAYLTALADAADATAAGVLTR
ncbi:MarR family transcriptional regulator [Microbacterium fluvii]|uniref:MarR family transcriptional regulator n=1 Tax=Microbacterium fluvii TaxID=415215 RepID=A0ABW2HDK9_9MICO|nr:MarR family transcriptional regulator [Microbacterium fluvii]MCU4672986.1 MarR family transcriptional regulator [Microbacterium fluvii]